MSTLLFCRSACAKTELSSIVQRKKLLSDAAPSDVFRSMVLQSAKLEAILKTNAVAEFMSMCFTPVWQSNGPQIHLYRECAQERFQLVARAVTASDHDKAESCVVISFEQFLPFVRHVLMGGDDADRALLVHVFQQVCRVCRALEQQGYVQGYRGPSLRRLTHLVREQLSEEMKLSVIRLDLPDECEDLKREESPLRWIRQGKEVLATMHRAC